MYFVSKLCYKEIADELAKSDEVRFLESLPSLNYSESTHADMQIFSKDDGSVIVRKDFDTSILGSIPYEMDSNGLSADYPSCVSLNVLYLDNEYIHLKKATSPEIAVYAQNKGREIINVSQGYSSCNTLYLPVSDASRKGLVISGDESILKVCKGLRYETFKVDSSGILLPGYDHGFIGGATFFDREFNILFANGSLSDFNPTLYDKISKLSIKIVQCARPLLDIGGVVKVKNVYNQ